MIKNQFILTPANSVLKVLAWFDLFDYPLTLPEIQFFLDRPLAHDELKAQLQELTGAHIVFRPGGFYALQNKEALAVKRIKGNQRAQKMLVTAHRVARLLYYFPYVRGIGISGSLSKNFAGDKADIDLFIITCANRLWIARTAMHLLKKLSYLLGKQHWFCMNYYIDEEALKIQEQNIFTATELITLKPVCGNGAIGHFFKANNWVQHYYPSYTVQAPACYDPGKGYRVKRFLECLFNNRVGDQLDQYLMNVTARRWKQKEERQLLNMRGIRLSMKADKHSSRPGPGYFQQSILEQYQRKLEALYTKWNQVQAASFGL